MNGETKKDHVGESVRGKMGEREGEKKQDKHDVKN